MATIKYKENGEWVELSIGGGGGIKMYQVYLNPANDDEKAVNVEAYNAIKNSEDALFYYIENDTTIRYLTVMSDGDVVGVQFIKLTPLFETLDTASYGIDKYVINYSYRLINSDGSTELLIKNSAHLPTVAKVKEMISEAGGGGSITVDSEMSDTSENAVSNKVIKEYVDGAVKPIGDSVRELQQVIADNEEVIAKAMNDLNTRLDDIVQRLENTD